LPEDDNDHDTGKKSSKEEQKNKKTAADNLFIYLVAIKVEIWLVLKLYVLLVLKLGPVLQLTHTLLC